MMGFLFGMLVGGAMSGGAPPQAQAMLSQIPIRCFVLVGDEKSYTECRYPSLYKELADTVLPSCNEFAGREWRGCQTTFIVKNIKWEIAALKELAAASAKKQEQH
jgi:hypothetical protein